MISNKDIARTFNLLASLMELHGENAFKAKAYSSAYLTLRKWEKPLLEMPDDALDQIPGVGASVISKIRELRDTGRVDALEKLKAITPEGVQQLLTIKGLGPKKVKVIWDELKVESPAELLYACNENRLIKLSGFGLKTQEDLKQKIAYFLDSQDSYLYGNIEAEMSELLNILQKAFPGHKVSWAGAYATLSPVIPCIECLSAPPVEVNAIAEIDKVAITAHEAHGLITFQYDERLKITIHTCAVDDYPHEWSRLTWNDALFEKVKAKFSASSDPASLLADAGYPALPVELYDKEGVDQLTPVYWDNLVTEKDIRGIIHNHSTYSDGMNTLEEMSLYVRDKGYEYFVICDHSRSAFYANGLQPERVLQQIEEIDQLNTRLAPFKVFKGIESDILGDGSLDYEEDILKRFDLIVASVHSNLNMDEDKAMMRLIRAIENPYTRILGHPTGRLLLARQGYPIDHRKIIDACASNGVVIELNANSLRLDIDYKWLDYCMEKNVLVAINPDAHSRPQVDYVKYGVYAARKGGLKRDYCLNGYSLEKFEQWLKGGKG